MNDDRPMEPDEYQQAWQSQSAETRVTVDANLLLKEVYRHQQNFRSTIFWRDFREVGVGLLMLPFWVYMGVTQSLPWTWWLTVPAILWVIGFILVDRMRHPQRPSEPGEPLLECVKKSLTQVEHQIWLLRNVFWWYLLPFAVAILAFFTQTFCQAAIETSDWLTGLVAVTFSFVFVLSIDYWLYFVNQRAVKLELEPRRRELLNLLTSLTEETSSADSYEIVPASLSPFAESRSKPAGNAAGRTAIGLLGVVLILFLLEFAFDVIPELLKSDGPLAQQGTDSVQAEGYPKLSPYAAVRWQDFQPEVQLGDEWFKLVSLNELPASEIVAFSRRSFGSLWQKRFEEDLVELLSGMKHPPGDKVTLVVKSLTTGEESVREGVPMTRANRRAIWNAGRTRPNSPPERQLVARSFVSIEDKQQFKERIDEFLQRAQVRAGFSGVVVVARGGEPVYEGAVGFSHLATKTPHTLETPYRIAALSQTFTAAAILHLESEGKLSTDDPVHKYLPEFAAEPYRDITIYQLLTHSSGLPRISEGAAGYARWDAMSKAPTLIDDYVQLACECPLKFEPGQSSLYTNFGYRILSAIIVQVTGMPFAEFMEEQVFQTLDLKQTGVARTTAVAGEEKVAEVVSLKSLDRRSREPSFVSTDSGHNYGTGYGSGGIYSSANDLLRWDRVLASNDFLTEEQRDKMFRPARDYIACGWIVKESVLDGRLYHSNIGANSGYFCRMMRIPEDDLVIITLGNVHRTEEIRQVMEQLFRLCRSLPYEEL